jgi:hypothetical protein
MAIFPEWKNAVRKIFAVVPYPLSIKESRLTAIAKGRAAKPGYGESFFPEEDIY